MGFRRSFFETALNAVVKPIEATGNQEAILALYERSLKLVMDVSTPYAFGVEREAGRPAPSFYRPPEAFATRFEALKSAAEEAQARNLLDVGCAEGYMIRRAATELGMFSVGLEMDRARIRVGNAYSELNDDRGYGIVPAMVDADYLRTLPAFDVVVCFSVLHHVVRHGSIEIGVDFLKALGSVTRKRFLFDMGSPEETDNDPAWGEVLAFLNGDIVGNNAKLLEKAGFRDIRHIGDTPGFIKEKSRPLFDCTPPGP